jgi:ribonuclease-3
VEDIGASVGDLRESCLPREASAPCGVSVMRAIRASRRPSTGALVLIRSEATAIRLPAGDLLSELGMSVDPELLDRALTHRSYAYEQGGLPTNERLEFLGDSVLGLVVTEHLFVTYPDLSEGQLAKLRAAVVNSRALADIGRHLDLGAVIHLGRGEESTGGRDKSSILADTMEAVIGAVFLQHGIEAARGFVHHLFDPLMAEVATRGAGLDWKTSLQEIASVSGLGVPVYDVVESGPDHAKTFQAMVNIDDQSYGPGAGRNKKEAEQNAAAIAFAALKGSRGTGPITAR